MFYLFSLVNHHEFSRALKKQLLSNKNVLWDSRKIPGNKILPQNKPWRVNKTSFTQLLTSAETIKPDKKMTNDRQVQRFSPTTVQCDIKLSLQWKEKWHCAVWHQTKRRRGGVRNTVLLSRWWERWGEFSHCWSERSPQNLTLRQWFIGFVKSSCCRETIGLAGAYLEEGGSHHIIRQGSHLLPSTSGLWPRLEYFWERMATVCLQMIWRKVQDDHGYRWHSHLFTSVFLTETFIVFIKTK